MGGERVRIVIQGKGKEKTKLSTWGDCDMRAIKTKKRGREGRKSIGVGRKVSLKRKRARIEGREGRKVDRERLRKSKGGGNTNGKWGHGKRGSGTSEKNKENVYRTWDTGKKIDTLYNGRQSETSVPRERKTSCT